MKLLVQPDDGVGPLLKGLDAAKETIDILIFRFDQREIEQSLVKAVERGVKVHALIAYTNRGGERNLRALELRLLAAGVTVSRTADDLVRYHGKMIIIDHKELYLLAFNFTRLNIERMRSFGIITSDPAIVQEASKLFQADSLRQPYLPKTPGFVVSPINAREELSKFLIGAKKELLIYDPDLSDPAMIDLLAKRIENGVDIRLIGRCRRGSKIESRKLVQIALHARVIVRDGSHVFVGSQSLRAAELDDRREIGIIVHDGSIASAIAKTFNRDWDLREVLGIKEVDEPLPAGKIAKKVAKVVTKVFPAVAPVVEVAVTEIAGEGVELPLNPEKLQHTVEAAVKDAIKTAVREAFEEVAERELTEK